ncbi:hypothetical protein HYV49_05280 [Candidatus Pacearchaeota archaeon]|nr:hypothetical protein [Candidatus Pacearchaeota archaeon]
MKKKLEHDSFCPVFANEKRSPEFKVYGPLCSCTNKKWLTENLKKELRKIIRKNPLLPMAFKK